MTTPPATEAPASKADAGRVPTEEAAAGIRAPSAKAAVVAPALGLAEAEVVKDDDLPTRSTATPRKAADPDED